MNLDVYSVGHSNHPVDVFLGLLKEHSIETVADVRSNPHSRFAPRYNQGALLEVLEGNGFSYIFLGRELGGRPGVPDFYNAAGGVLYERIAASAPFQQRIERFWWNSKVPYRVYVRGRKPSQVSSPVSPTRALHRRGIRVGHIRATGVVETEDKLTFGGPQRDSSWTCQVCLTNTVGPVRSKSGCGIGRNSLLRLIRVR